MSRGGSRVTQKHALKIAKKLKAEKREGSNHTIATIKHDNKVVAWFQIRRSRKADHGLIHENLHLSQTQTVSMAECHIDPDEYFAILKQKGKL